MELNAVARNEKSSILITKPILFLSSLHEKVTIRTR